MHTYTVRYKFQSTATLVNVFKIAKHKYIENCVVVAVGVCAYISALLHNNFNFEFSFSLQLMSTEHS